MADKPEPKRRTPQLTEALQSAIEKAKEYERDASKTELEKRYAIGKLAKTVQEDSGKYGRFGVLRLANALGRDKSTLFRAAKIATHWDGAAFRELVRTKGESGLGITWSHLELVAEKESAKERAALVARVLAKGLSVRSLKKTLRDGKPKLAGTAAIAKAIAEAAKTVRRVERLVLGLPERLANAESATAPEVVAALKDLRRRLRSLRDATKATLPAGGERVGEGTPAPTAR